MSARSRARRRPNTGSRSSARCTLVVPSPSSSSTLSERGTPSRSSWSTYADSCMRAVTRARRASLLSCTSPAVGPHRGRGSRRSPRTRRGERGLVDDVGVGGECRVRVRDRGCQGRGIRRSRLGDLDDSVAEGLAIVRQHPQLVLAAECVRRARAWRLRALRPARCVRGVASIARSHANSHSAAALRSLALQTTRASAGMYRNGSPSSPRSYGRGRTADCRGAAAGRALRDGSGAVVELPIARPCDCGIITGHFRERCLRACRSLEGGLSHRPRLRPGQGPAYGRAHLLHSPHGASARARSVDSVHRGAPLTGAECGGTMRRRPTGVTVDSLALPTCAACVVTGGARLHHEENPRRTGIGRIDLRWRSERTGHCEWSPGARPVHVR